MNILEFAMELHVEYYRRNKMRLERRRMRDAQNSFELPNDQFIKIYRLSQEATIDLIQQLELHVDPSRRRTAIPFHLKVLVTLNFLGQGSFQRAVGISSWTCLSQPIVSRAISEVCMLISQRLMHNWVKFPTDAGSTTAVKYKFYERWGTRGIIGAIDGTHIQIIAPPKTDNDHPPFVYLNRKGKHSINVMVVCDADQKIIAIDARYPGSVHDAAIFRMSNIRAHLIREYRNGLRGSYLIGDSGYGVEPWLLTPFLNSGNNTPEERYNNLITSARNVVERTFGIWKRRFACLSQHRVLLYHPSKAAYIIYACGVLHNMALHYNVVLNEDDDFVEENNEEIENNEQFVMDAVANLGRQARNQYIKENGI